MKPARGSFIMGTLFVVSGVFCSVRIRVVLKISHTESLQGKLGNGCVVPFSGACL